MSLPQTSVGLELTGGYINSSGGPVDPFYAQPDGTPWPDDAAACAAVPTAFRTYRTVNVAGVAKRWTTDTDDNDLADIEKEPVWYYVEDNPDALNLSVGLLDPTVELPGGSTGNVFHGGNRNMTFGSAPYYNVFGVGVVGISTGTNFALNQFDVLAHQITVGNFFIQNRIGSNAYALLFGNGCSQNVVGSDCHDLKVGDDGRGNEFVGRCTYVELGAGCINVTLIDCSNLTDAGRLVVPPGTTNVTYRNNALVPTGSGGSGTPGSFAALTGAPDDNTSLAAVLAQLRGSKIEFFAAGPKSIDTVYFAVGTALGTGLFRPKSSYASSTAVTAQYYDVVWQALDPAFALDRANHTGFQAISTITGLSTALSAKLNTSGGTLTGAVYGLTPVPGTNDTQLATTAFVQGAKSPAKITTYIRDTATNQTGNVVLVPFNSGGYINVLINDGPTPSEFRLFDDISAPATVVGSFATVRQMGSTPLTVVGTVGSSGAAPTVIFRDCTPTTSGLYDARDVFKVDANTYLVTPHYGPQSEVYATLDYTPSITLDFNAPSVRTLLLTGDVNFANAINMAQGKSKQVVITADGTTRGISFPSAWRWYGAKPTSIAAGKEGMLTLQCLGPNQADVRAAFGVEL